MIIWRIIDSFSLIWALMINALGFTAQLFQNLYTLQKQQSVFFLRDAIILGYHYFHKI